MRLCLILISCVVMTFMSSCNDVQVPENDGATSVPGGNPGGVPPVPPVAQASLTLTSASAAIAQSSQLQWSQVNIDASYTQLFFIANTGTNVINLSGGPNFIQVTGSPAFTVSAQPISAVVPANNGGSQAFNITFAPTSVGAHSCTVTIASDDPASPFSFSINCLAVSLIDPEIGIQGPSAIVIASDGSDSPSINNDTDFAQLPVGSHRIVEYTITNTGNVELNLTDLINTGSTPRRVAIAGADAASFTVLNDPDTPIAPGDSTSFEVDFTPASLAQLDYYAELILQSDDRDEDQIVIHLHAQSYDPAIVVSGNGQAVPYLSQVPMEANFTDFGAVPVGASISRQFTIRNNKSEALDIDDLTVTGPQNIIGEGVFRIDAMPGAQVLQAGESTTFTLSYHPATYGQVEAEVFITHSDDPINEFTFKIVGTGLAAEIQVTGNGQVIADGDLNPSVLDDTDFGTAMFQIDSTTRTFTIENIGNAVLTFVDPEIARIQANSKDF
ncbi:MAG: choice-of-anchor D domain-containing protein, partial [Planctomycetes bacterium]|nr:choice-of-anchor D domain-containing protein [Planctomycetota bacterium]